MNIDLSIICPKITITILISTKREMAMTKGNKNIQHVRIRI